MSVKIKQGATDVTDILVSGRLGLPAPTTEGTILVGSATGTTRWEQRAGAITDNNDSLVTSELVYESLPTINGNKMAANPTFYAPLTKGEENQVLMGNASNEPGWVNYIQQPVLPTPTQVLSDANTIYQYIGETDLNYVNGTFYRCIEDPAVPGTYIWDKIESRMSVRMNGHTVNDPDFYAPTQSGTAGMALISNGAGQPPVWKQYIQHDAFPAADALYDGEIWQYIGNDPLSGYTTGRFYQCIATGTGAYTWAPLGVYTMINGNIQSDPEIYAPVQSGNDTDILMSKGVNNAPEWVETINNNTATALEETDKFVTERTVYNGLPTINNTHDYTAATTIYAPSVGGTDLQVLVGDTVTSAPVWRDLANSDIPAAIGESEQIPTEQDIYNGLPKINGEHDYTANTNVFAPLRGGAIGQVLRSTGNTEPRWADCADNSVPTALSNTNDGVATERSIYYGTPQFNGTHNYTSSTEFWVPTTPGTTGYVLASQGPGNAPIWVDNNTFNTTTDTPQVYVNKLPNGSHTFFKTNNVNDGSYYESARSLDGQNAIITFHMVDGRQQILTMTNGVWDTQWTEKITINGQASASLDIYGATTVGDQNQYLVSRGTGAPIWRDCEFGKTDIVTIDARYWVNGEYDLEALYPSTDYEIEVSLSSAATDAQITAFNLAKIIGDDAGSKIIAKGVTPTIDIPVKIRKFRG